GGERAGGRGLFEPGVADDEPLFVFGSGQEFGGVGVDLHRRSRGRLRSAERVGVARATRGGQPGFRAARFGGQLVLKGPGDRQDGHDRVGVAIRGVGGAEERGGGGGG